MLGSKIVEKAYRLTNRDSTTFLDGNSTNVYLDLNTCYGHRILDVLRVSLSKNATIKEVTTDLVSVTGLTVGQAGYNGEYPFPTDLLRPVRLEVSFDGLTWKKCTVYDNSINFGSEYNNNDINGEFSQSEPRVDFLRDSFKIRPLNTGSTVINGIYIEYEKRQADFTSTTSPEIEATLQDLLAYDLAEMEMIMHADSYSANQLALFKTKQRDVEQNFLSFYMWRLPEKKTMTFNYNNYQ